MTGCCREHGEMEGDEPLWRPLKERGSSPTANRSAFDEATWLLPLFCCVALFVCLTETLSLLIFASDA